MMAQVTMHDYVPYSNTIVAIYWHDINMYVRSYVERKTSYHNLYSYT